MSNQNPAPDFEFSDTLRRHMRLRSQVDILYSQSVVTFFFPVIFAGLLTVLLWNVANRTILLAWLVIVVIYALARYALLWSFRRSDRKKEDRQKWLDLFVFFACLSGVMWGSAGVVLIPYQQDNLIEFTLYNGLTMLAVCGMVAGAVVSYCVSMTVLLFYSFPALVPPAIYLISLGDQYNSALGGFIFLYFLFISLAAYRMNRQLLYYLYKDYEFNHLLQEYRKLEKMYNARS